MHCMYMCMCVLWGLKQFVHEFKELFLAVLAVRIIRSPKLFTINAVLLAWVDNVN